MINIYTRNESRRTLWLNMMLFHKQLYHLFISKRHNLFIQIFISTLFFTELASAIFSNVGLAQKSVLVIRKDSIYHREVVSGMAEELGTDFIINELILDKNTTEEQVINTIKNLMPDIVVLMDNKSIDFFRQYQLTLTDKDHYIPSIAVMGILLDEAIHELHNAACIYYEIPIVTSVVNFRAIVDTPVKKVGVIYRQVMDNFIQKNKEYCAQEAIEIVPYVLPNENYDFKSGVRKGLQKLLKQEDVDVLWIPNDNILLKPDIFSDAWLPLVEEYQKPLIVGTRSLVNPKLKFGVFAVLPDHLSLGSQTAELIYTMMDNNWIFDGIRAEPPISVNKIINLTLMKELGILNNKGLDNIDEILQ